MSRDYIKIILFTILCVCSIFYLFIGIYSYKIDKKSKTNIIFFTLCISANLWAIGYAFMLISPNIEIANLWRIVSALGWCFFNGIWLSFALSLRNAGKKNFDSKVQYLAYMAAIIFFISNLIFEPSKVVDIETYGFVDDLYAATTIGSLFSIYLAVLFIAGLVIIYFQLKNSKKNRVKKQMKIILITSLISFCLVAISDVILPSLGIMTFPFGIIEISIGMGGMWYAINKYKMMSISYELVSENLFETVNEPIFILGEDFIVKNCNEATLNITGATYKDLKGILLDAIINLGNFNFNTIMQTGNVNNIEVGLHRENNEALVCELSATVIYDEYKDVLGILVLLHDVSERKNLAEIQKKHTLKLEESNKQLQREISQRKRTEGKMQYLATHDSLTRLPNRLMFTQLLNHSIQLAKHHKRKLAVFFIDLDRFKIINDTKGHDAGDLLLQEIALRYKLALRAADVVSRLGGDEFVILIEEFKELSDLEIVANIILSNTLKPIILLGEECRITASIGISIYPKDGEDGQSLMKNADTAMYYAKEEGKNNFQFYSKDIQSISTERLEIETNLRLALERNEFSLHYQAQVNFKTGMITGVEALLRWQNPSLGSVTPTQFIPVAEETGMIIAIGEWVLRTACAQNVIWQKQGLPAICMAVNLSLRQFTDNNLIDKIKVALNDSGMEPNLLELEITESMMMSNPTQMIALIDKIKKLGVRLAIDDFGTGYSSLSQIQRFPIDTLKIDQSFIRNLLENDRDDAITHAIIAMGKTLGLNVVAEGVETVEQMNFLKEQSCDEMQGDFFSKPVEPDKFADLLKKYAPTSPAL